MVIKIVFSLISVPSDVNSSYGNRGNRGQKKIEVTKMGHLETKTLLLVH